MWACSAPDPGARSPRTAIGTPAVLDLAPSPTLPSGCVDCSRSEAGARLFRTCLRAPSSSFCGCHGSAVSSSRIGHPRQTACGRRIQCSAYVCIVSLGLALALAIVLGLESTVGRAHRTARSTHRDRAIVRRKCGPCGDWAALQLQRARL